MESDGAPVSVSTLLVKTLNSLYRIITSAHHPGPCVLVQARRCFLEVTKTHLAGAGYGNNLR